MANRGTQRAMLCCRSCAHWILNTNTSRCTHRELRERRPWKASEANSDIWLLLKSLRGGEPKKKKKEKRDGEIERNIKSVRGQSKQEGNTSLCGWLTGCTLLLIYSHPAQLLIRREGSGRDHLDGVLLQSSGTEHTHRGAALTPARNAELSPLYRWLLLGFGEHSQIRSFDAHCQHLSRFSDVLPSLTSIWAAVHEVP